MSDSLHSPEGLLPKGLPHTNSPNPPSEGRGCVGVGSTAGMHDILPHPISSNAEASIELSPILLGGDTGSGDTGINDVITDELTPAEASTDARLGGTGTACGAGMLCGSGDGSGDFCCLDSRAGTLTGAWLTHACVCPATGLALSSFRATVRDGVAEEDTKQEEFS